MRQCFVPSGQASPGSLPVRHGIERPFRAVPLTGGVVLSVVLACGLSSPAWSGTVCKDIPTSLDEQAAREAFGAGDAALFTGARARLEAALNGLCDGNGVRLFHRKVRRVDFRMAAGATEPTPWLEDATLVVEFAGGPFQAARFRRVVGEALRGKPAKHDD